MNAITAHSTLTAIAQKTAPRSMDRDSVSVTLWPATASDATTRRAVYQITGPGFRFSITLAEDGRPIAAGTDDKWAMRIWDKMADYVTDHK